MRAGVSLMEYLRLSMTSKNVSSIWAELYVFSTSSIEVYPKQWLSYLYKPWLDIFGWYHQCILNVKKGNITVPFPLALENPLKMVDWLVFLYSCCSFFGSLDILRVLKQQSTGRSTVDIKMWSVQWWMQMDAIIPQMLGLDQRTCCRVGLLLEVVDSF